MRTEIEHRLLVVGALGVTLGIASRLTPWLALGLLIGLWLLRPLGAKATLLVAAVVGFAISTGLHVHRIDEREFFDGQVTVVSVPQKTPMGYRVEVDAGQSVLLMRLDGPEAVGLGDRVAVVGLVDPPSESQDSILASRGISGTLTPARLTVVSQGSFAFRLAARWRRAFMDLSAKSLGPTVGAAVDALCFNVDSGLGTTFRQNLRRTGTIHIISASGMHVMIFAWALLLILGKLPIPRWAQLLALTLVLGFYAIAAGLRPPVVRSVVMATIVMPAYLFRREADWISALAAAWLLALLAQPVTLLDMGFQLSFLAVASLSLYARVWPAGAGVWGTVAAKAKTAVHTSLVASAGSAPVVAYHFGMVSIISVLANLLIALAIGPIVVVALASLAIDTVSEPIAVGAMRFIVLPLTGWVMAVVDTLGSWSWSAADVPPFSAVILIPFYGGLLALWRRRPREA